MLIDDESCTYCDNFEAVLISSSDATLTGLAMDLSKQQDKVVLRNYSLIVYDANGIHKIRSNYVQELICAKLTDNVLLSMCYSNYMFEPIITQDPCDIAPTGFM